MNAETYTLLRQDGSSAYAGALLVGGRLDKDLENVDFNPRAWEQLNIDEDSIPQELGPFKIEEHRPWDSPQLVYLGVAQAALTNKDCLLYRRADERLWGQSFVGDIEIKREFEDLGRAELCILYDSDRWANLKDIDEWKEFPGKVTVISEAPAYAKYLLKSRYEIDVEIMVPSQGGTEKKLKAFSRKREYKAIALEIVATGTTIEKLNIKKLEVVLHTNACLIVNPEFEVKSPDIVESLVSRIDENYQRLRATGGWALLKELLPYYKYTGRNYYELELQPGGLAILDSFRQFSELVNKSY